MVFVSLRRLLRVSLSHTHISHVPPLKKRHGSHASVLWTLVSHLQLSRFCVRVLCSSTSYMLP
jgi:hypothetical protein